MKNNHENAWRVLQGLKPIQSVKCRIGWHRWTHFEIFEGDYTIGGHGVSARCYCADCGLPRMEFPVSLLNRKKQ